MLSAHLLFLLNNTAIIQNMIFGILKYYNKHFKGIRLLSG